MTKQEPMKSASAMTDAQLTSEAVFFMLGLQPLGADLAIGVKEITRRILGKDDPKSVRSMFHALEKSNSIPWSRGKGSQICVQMSSYRAKLWSQERRAWAERDDELLVKTHLLLSATLPLMIDYNLKRINDADLRRLTVMTAEAAATLRQLLRSIIP